MKRTVHKLLSLVLVIAVVFSMLSLPAMAQDPEPVLDSGEGQVICTKTEGCQAQEHQEGCPHFTAPQPGPEPDPQPNGGLDNTPAPVNESRSNDVAQVGGTGYATFGDALTAAKNGGTLTLLANVTAESAITVASGEALTLDLGDFTLNLGNNSLTNNGTLTVTGGKGTLTAANHTIANHGTLSIEGGVIDSTKHAKAALYNYSDGTASITGGTLTRSGEKGSSPTEGGGNSWYVINNEGVITEIGGDARIISNSYYSSLIRNVGKANQPDTGKIEKITGGTFEHNFVILKNDDYSKIGTISGGTFTVGEGASQTAVLLNYGAIGEISGGDFTNNGEWAVVNCSNWEGSPAIEGTIGKISGGTFTTQGDGTALALKNSSKPGAGVPKVTVTDGEFTGKITQNTGALTIEGGSFDGAIDKREGGTLTITGGTFTADPSAYVTTEGYAAVKEADGYKVGKKQAGGNVPVEEKPVVAPPKEPDVTVPSTGLTEEQKTEVETAAKGVSSAGLATEAAKVTVTEADKAAAKAALEADPNINLIEGQKVTVVAEPFFKIEVADYDPASNVLALEIDPMVQLKATTDPDNMSETDDSSKNTVPVGAPKPLAITESVEIIIPLPASFAADHLFIKHMKGDGTVYYYKVDVLMGDGLKFAKFTNPNGFSSFTLLQDTRSGSIQFSDGKGTGSFDLSKVGDPLPTVSKSGYRFDGWKINGKVYTTLTDELLTVVNGKTNLAAAAQFTRIGGGSGGSGAVQASDDAYDFWMGVKEKIEGSSANRTIQVNARDYDQLPASVMDALRAKSVTLVIDRTSGGSITIPAGKAQKNDGNRVYWSLSDLAKLYQGAKPAPSQGSEPAAINPETGSRPSGPIVTEGGCFLLQSHYVLADAFLSGSMA